MRAQPTKAALLSAALVALVGAASPTQQNIVAQRLAGYRELGAAFKNVNDQLRSGSPQLVVLQLSARQISAAARTQYSWFPAGSGPAANVKTHAKPAIWAQPAQFKAAQDGFAAQAGAFQKLAQAGDIPGMKLQARKLGAACAACHNAFRVEQ